MESRIGLVSTAELYIRIQSEGGLLDHKTPGFGHPCLLYYLSGSDRRYCEIPDTKYDLK